MIRVAVEDHQHERPWAQVVNHPPRDPRAEATDPSGPRKPQFLSQQ